MNIANAFNIKFYILKLTCKMHRILNNHFPFCVCLRFKTFSLYYFTLSSGLFTQLSLAMNYSAQTLISEKPNNNAIDNKEKEL